MALVCVRVRVHACVHVCVCVCVCVCLLGVGVRETGEGALMLRTCHYVTGMGILEDDSNINNVHLRLASKMCGTVYYSIFLVLVRCIFNASTCSQRGTHRHYYYYERYYF